MREQDTSFQAPFDITNIHIFTDIQHCQLKIPILQKYSPHNKSEEVTGASFVIGGANKIQGITGFSCVDGL